MVNKVNKEEWLAVLSSHKQLNSLFFNPDFLSVVKDAFDYQVHYFVVVQKQVPLFAAAIFSKGKDVVVPLAFTYSSIYIDKTISDRKRIDLLKSFIDLLKKDFRKISFRFNADLEDLRPFTWLGFKLDLRYTYIKQIGEGVHQSVLRNVERAKSDGYYFKAVSVDDESIKRNLDDFSHYGLSKKAYGQYHKLFDELFGMGCLKSFNVYLGEQLVCSNIVLLDEKTHQLYTLLINKTDHKNATSYLYKEAIDWCKDHGYRFIDYCGANEERIADFKSYFNPHLSPYYLVSFVPYENQTNLIKQKFKAIVKRVIR